MSGPFIVFSVDAGVTRAFDSWDGDDGVLYWVRRLIEEATTDLLIPVVTALDYMALTPESGGKVELPNGIEVEVKVADWAVMVVELSDAGRWTYEDAARYPNGANAEFFAEILSLWNDEFGVAAQEKGGER